MELDLKWRRKRSGRRLRPPFIAAPPANREGCWAVTWRWVRRAPCREELEASEGRSGASCRGARGRQWERLREARVAGAEGNNGGGTWESRGGTSIAVLRVRSDVAPGGRAERTGESVVQDRWAGNPERRRRRATVPLALRAACVARPVRLSPLQHPQSPSAELLLLRRRLLLRQKGGVHPARLAEAAARAPGRPHALPAHACFVLAPAGSSRAESGVRDDRLRPGGGGFSAVGSGASAAGAPQPGSVRSPGLAEAAAEGGACSDDWRCAKAHAVGGEGVRRRARQGALTSRARHSRDSGLHVPRASRAGSTGLRRASARAPDSGLGCSLLCSRPREAYFDGWRSRLSGGQ